MQQDDGLQEAADFIMSDEYQIWIKDTSFRRLHDYVQRGRAYSELSDADAVGHWVASVKLYAQDPEIWDRYQDYLDIESELSLRRIDPPILDMLEEFQKLREYSKRRANELKKDPRDWERRGQAMRHDLIDCLTSIEEGKHRAN